jgi:hypothetical protein
MELLCPQITGVYSFINKLLVCAIFVLHKIVLPTLHVSFTSIRALDFNLWVSCLGMNVTSILLSGGSKKDF